MGTHGISVNLEDDKLPARSWPHSWVWQSGACAYTRALSWQFWCQICSLIPPKERKRVLMLTVAEIWGRHKVYKQFWSRVRCVYPWLRRGLRSPHQGVPQVSVFIPKLLVKMSAVREGVKNKLNFLGTCPTKSRVFFIDALPNEAVVVFIFFWEGGGRWYVTWNRQMIFWTN